MSDTAIYILVQKHRKVETLLEEETFVTWFKDDDDTIRLNIKEHTSFLDDEKITKLLSNGIVEIHYFDDDFDECHCTHILHWLPRNETHILDL